MIRHKARFPGHCLSKVNSEGTHGQILVEEFSKQTK